MNHFYGWIPRVEIFETRSHGNRFSHVLLTEANLCLHKMQICASHESPTKKVHAILFCMIFVFLRTVLLAETNMFLQEKQIRVSRRSKKNVIFRRKKIMN